MLVFTVWSSLERLNIVIRRRVSKTIREDAGARVQKPVNCKIINGSDGDLLLLSTSGCFMRPNKIEVCRRAASGRLLRQVGGGRVGGSD